MISLNRDHPAFDMDGELCALLPVAPWFIDEATVHRDLGANAKLLTSIKRLAELNFIRVIKNDWGLAIARESWELAQQLAERYVTSMEA